MIEFDFSEFEKFADELANQFPQYALEAAVPAMESAMLSLLENTPEYPAEILDALLPPDGVSWLRTDKQRRWFFAAVKSGDVVGWKWIDNHPEKVGGGRTGNLGRAQTYEVEQNGEEVSGTIGFDKNLAPYAPWVVGDDYPGQDYGSGAKYQAKIHVDRWWQFRVIMEQNVEQAWSEFNETFWIEFQKRVNNG